MARDPARLHDVDHVLIADDRGRTLRARLRRLAAVERVPVGVGEDLHRFATLVRIGGDQGRDTLRDPSPQPLCRLGDDPHDLRLGERLEVHGGAPRADRCVDRIGLARGRTDQDEIGRCAVGEELLHVGGDVGVVLVVVRRLEDDALVLENLEQLGLQHRIHLAQLVDEQHAAVGARNQAEFRLGNPAIGEIPAASLIDRIVHAAQQRVGRLARIPAQRRAVGFDERGIRRERCPAALLRRFEREARNRRFTDAGRPEQDHVLRKRRGDLRKQRRDRGLLPHDRARASSGAARRARSR